MTNTPKNFDGKMTKPPETLTITECHQLLAALMPENCTHKQRLKSIRNYTMALLMLDAGLRVGEMVRLYQGDLHYRGEPMKSLFIHAAITKTKTERLIPLSTRIQQSISEMSKLVWNDHPDLQGCHAFCRTGSIRPLTTRQVERIISAAALKSIGRPIHPHVLRHTFASKLMRKTSMRVVQELLGHKLITSTQIYTHPNNDDLKKAIGELDSE